AAAASLASGLLGDVRGSLSDLRALEGCQTVNIRYLAGPFNALAAVIPAAMAPALYCKQRDAPLAQGQT
ncbi:hypothetical protein QJQ45_017928, partial [Haematococcus lacustris]